MLTMLDPTRYALFMKCREHRATERKGPYVLVDRLNFVIDRDQKKTLPGKPDYADYMSLRFDARPDHHFMYCASLTAGQPGGRLPTDKADMRRIVEKFSTQDFCCDIFSEPTDFFLYDKHAGVLTHFGHYHALGSVEETRKYAKAMHAITGLSHLTGDARKAKVREAWGWVRREMEGLRIRRCKVACKYKPLGEVHVGDTNVHMRTAYDAYKLRNCLKSAVKKLLGGRPCDDPVPQVLRYARK